MAAQALPAPEATPAIADLPEPAPAFPVQLSARVAARLGNITATLQQDWHMEGYRYAIRVSGRRLGTPLLAHSEGRVTPDGGLLPERSEARVGDTTRSITEYGNGLIRLGRPGQMREEPLPLVPQDLLSLPFHLAVTFDGAPLTLFVSSGHTVQQYRFTLVAEEVLRMPVGRLRTLHLSGAYFDYRLRDMLPVVDVWLARDFLNVPVKVSGHLRDGLPFEYRLEHLEMEGSTVLDSSRPELSLASDDAMAPWREARPLRDLKNP